jgi:protein NrfC
MEVSFMAVDRKIVPNKAEREKQTSKKYTRRDFVVGSGVVIAGGALSAVSSASAATATTATAEKTEYPLSKGYLVYDSKHCAGCYGCMLACSLAHEGETNLSLARIQVHRAVLAEYPLDIQINVCRQCPDPLCVANCPTGAAHVSADNANVRMIDAEKCIGCRTCIKFCPFIPHRPIWNPAAKKATKCDLCVDTPYYNKKGGPGASQACVEVCPANAIAFVAEPPSQTDISGYDRNLQPPPEAEPNFPFPKGAPGAKSKTSPAAAPARNE